MHGVENDNTARRGFLWLIRKATQLDIFGRHVDVSKNPRGRQNQSMSGQIHLPTNRPPGGGWQPIPASKHGGFRRRRGTKWEYWYPDGQHGTHETPREPTHGHAHPTTANGDGASVDYARAGGKQLRELAEGGDKAAEAEMVRRREKRAADGKAPVGEAGRPVVVPVAEAVAEPTPANDPGPVKPWAMSEADYIAHAGGDPSKASAEWQVAVLFAPRQEVHPSALEGVTAEASERAEQLQALIRVMRTMADQPRKAPKMTGEEIAGRLSSTALVAAFGDVIHPPHGLEPIWPEIVATAKAKAAGGPAIAYTPFKGVGHEVHKEAEREHRETRKAARAAAAAAIDREVAAEMAAKKAAPPEPEPAKPAKPVEPVEPTAGDGGLVSVSADEIPMNVAVQAHNGTSHVPERRGEQERDGYVQHIRAVEARMAKLIASTPERREELIQRLAEYKAGYRKRFLAYLSSRSGLMSTMVTGGSGFPVARMQRKGDVVDKRRDEALSWSETALKRLHNDFNPRGPRSISSDRDDAVTLLQAKLDQAVKLQATMTAANRIVRSAKLTDEQKVAKLVELDGLSERGARALLEPDFAGRKGFADFQITNNNANIKRMKDRVGEISTARGQETSEHAFETPGGEHGTVTDNVDENRVEIDFASGKPSAATIAKLKARGFKWASSKGVWQRQRNNSARYAAGEILGIKIPEPGTAAAPQATEPDEAMPAPNLVAVDGDARDGFKEIKTSGVYTVHESANGRVRVQDQGAGRQERYFVMLKRAVADRHGSSGQWEEVSGHTRSGDAFAAAAKMASSVDVSDAKERELVGKEHGVRLASVRATAANDGPPPPPKGVKSPTYNAEAARFEHRSAVTERGAVVTPPRKPGEAHTVVFGRWEGSDFGVTPYNSSKTYKTASGAEKAARQWTEAHDGPAPLRKSNGFAALIRKAAGQ